MRRLITFTLLVFSFAFSFSSIASAQSSRRYDDGGRGRSGGWRRYDEHGCIGGAQCRQNGRRITVALDGAPVLGVRFNAHDNIGTRADGKLTVRIDDTTVASYVDVQRNGSRHEFDVDGIRGRRLVIEAANDDEVEVSDIEVLYGRGNDRHDDDSYDRGYGDREHHRGGDHVYGDEGGCIGGAECGGRRARIEIPLRDRRVRNIRFFAHDNVGTRAGGRLRIRVDDRIIADDVDISRDGSELTFEGRGLRGDYLIIEPAADDEVVVRDIRVRYDH